VIACFLLISSMFQVEGLGQDDLEEENNLCWGAKYQTTACVGVLHINLLLS